MGILIGNFNYDNHRTYTWRKEWISEYESPWGVLEKFRYINVLSDKDIFNIFGTNEIKKKITKSNKNSNLVSLEGLAQNALIKVLGTDIKGLNEYFKKKTLDVLLTKQKNYSHYFKETVAFCPECVKYGFHSIWHQIAFVEKCPFHNIDLINKCPNCDTEIPYTIYSEKFKKPFHCKCNNSLIGENIDFNFTKKWSAASKFTIVSENLNHLLNLSEREVCLLQRSYFQDEYVKKFKGRVLDFLLPVADIQENSDKYLHSIIKSTNNIHLGNSNGGLKLDDFIKSIIHDQFNVAIPKSCKTVYLSISRYILKNIIFKHRACLRKLTFNGDSEEINPQSTCSYAYSYTMWKKSIEGLFYFSSVDNGRKRLRKPRDPDPLSGHLFYTILKGIRSNLSEYANEERHNTYKWVLHRVLAHILYYLYLNWVIYANNFIEDGEKHFIFNVKKAEIPFFLIKFPEIQNGQIEFHWWINKKLDLKAAINNMKCPY